MCDFNDYTFMRWKSDISHFLWKNYKYILAWGKRWEIEKGLNELKGPVGLYVFEGDREYLIDKFNEALAKFDKGD